MGPAVVDFAKVGFWAKFAVAEADSSSVGAVVGAARAKEDSRQMDCIQMSSSFVEAVAVVVLVEKNPGGRDYCLMRKHILLGMESPRFH